VYEAEVVLLQEQLLQPGGTDSGLPGMMYQLADLQVGGVVGLGGLSTQQG
jgi:hypothetical protein